MRVAAFIREPCRTSVNHLRNRRRASVPSLHTDSLIFPYLQNMFQMLIRRVLIQTTLSILWEGMIKYVHIKQSSNSEWYIGQAQIRE